MKIALAGGLGCEKSFLDRLKGHFIFLIGGKYLPEKERFEKTSAPGFSGEFLTHNYHSQLSEFELLIDLSENMKSKYLMSEISNKYSKKYITLYYDAGWMFFYSMPGGACLSCLPPLSVKVPPFLYPEIPVGPALDIFSGILLKEGPGSFTVSVPSGSYAPVEKSESCPVSNGLYSFITGEISDIISVSCGDSTVSVTPTTDFTIDLKEYKSRLEKHVKIKKTTPFFIEFKAQGFDMLVFRQGRMVVKGTKEKNTGAYFYRRYVG